MKKTINVIVAFAICLSAFTLLSSCSSNTETRATGPGVTKQVTIDTGFVDHVPVTKPCHLYKGGYAKNPQLVRMDAVWSPVLLTRNVTMTDDALAQAGYSYGTGRTVSAWVDSQYEGFWMCLLGIILLFLAAGGSILLYRYATSARREPGSAGFFGTVITHHHYPVPPRTTPNVPSYTSPHVNSMVSNLKAGLRSGRIIYQNGDELLVLEVDPPLEGATDVPSAAPANGTPNTGAEKKQEGATQAS